MSSKTLEYQDVSPSPVAQRVKFRDKNTTLFVTKDGRFVNFPTEDQARKKITAFMKRFKPEEWWAQKVSRFRLGNDDYLTAYIKRDFSEKHDRSDIANRSEHEMWLGREVIGIPSKTTDNDIHSETHGKRIPLTMSCQLSDGSVEDLPVLEKQGYYSYHKVTKENIALYKKMCGMTMDDIDTEYVFVLQKGGRNVGADDPDEIWTTTTADARLNDRRLKKIRRAKEMAQTSESTANQKLT